MSARDHLGRQFTVYRGIQKPASKVRKNMLGVHWTDDPGVAHEFGSGEGLGGYDRESRSHKGNPYSIIHATATSQSVEHDEEKLDEYDIAPGSGEKEIPLKENAKVKVHSITTVSDKRARKRSYKTPREMTT